MAVLTWDDVGERVYQTGVDRGVLYLQDGTAVAWNGIIGVEESSNGELKSYYLDGIKYLESLTPRDYVGKLKAFTYPDEFDAVNGIGEFAEGFEVYEQVPKNFNLSYRTKIGNGIDGLDHGYKIHLLFNVLAQADGIEYSTVAGSDISPAEFVWTLTGTPENIRHFRPTVHIAIDSRDTPPEVLSIIENKIYGTAVSSASFPTLLEIMQYFGYLGALLIIDHGDGTWTAIDEGGSYISEVVNDMFTINNADVTFLDQFTYTISSTNVE
jgi:hypothetical protein